jgi:peptidoglycan/xylan/chitin deacetylase (PgdA/CDA1 family)
MINHIKNGTLSDKFVSITLDDGYANNLTNALPILEENNVPATLFITAGRIGEPFMHLWENNIPNKDKDRPLSVEELKLIASSPLIEIGAHTMTHPRLCDLSRSDQEREIVTSKITLESIIKKPVNFFAYPYGSPNDFNEISIDITKNNFSCACTCTWSTIDCNTNIFSLPRIFMQNFDINKFEDIISGL